MVLGFGLGLGYIVGYYGFCSNFSRKWLEACEEVGIPHSHDINTKSGTLGATKVRNPPIQYITITIIITHAYLIRLLTDPFILYFSSVRIG